MHCTHRHRHTHTHTHTQFHLCIASMLPVNVAIVSEKHVVNFPGLRHGPQIYSFQLQQYQASPQQHVTHTQAKNNTFKNISQHNNKSSLTHSTEPVQSGPKAHYASFLITFMQSNKTCAHFVINVVIYELFNCY